MDLILAVETGGTKLQAVLGLPDGTILYRWRTRVDRAQGSKGILEGVGSAFSLLKAKADEMGRSITRVGWGFGGPVDAQAGIALGNPLISGWQDFPLRTFVRDRLGVPVYVFNDTNAAAWAEYCCGSGHGTDIFFYTNIGTGIGGGLIANGKLYDGWSYGAAEFGQTYIGNPWSLENYRCERLENLCSGTAIEERMRTMDIPPESMLMRLCSGDQSVLDCRMLGTAVKANDPFALTFFETITHLLAIGLSNVVSMFSPQKLSIGGGVSLIGEPLISRLSAYTRDYVFFSAEGKYEIVPCKLGEDVVLVGALLLAAKEDEHGMNGR